MSEPSSGASEAAATPSTATPRGRVARVLRLWFSFDDPVDRRTYIATGAALMAVKYGLELLLVFLATGTIWSPVAFFSPLFSLRSPGLLSADEWVMLALVVLTLPFLWVGVSMSVRRAVDAGLTAWAGVLFLVPLANYVAMFALAALPSKAGAAWQPRAAGPYRATHEKRPGVAVDEGLKSALYGVASAVALGLSMMVISVYALEIYGVALFFVTPFVMGAMSAYIFNRPSPRGLGETIGIALASTLIAGVAVLLFALEGAICLAMAFPIAGVIALLGSLVGRGIALQAPMPGPRSAALLFALPGLAGAEAATAEPPLYEVQTAIIVDAPPEVVWPHVIGFTELAPPSELLFATGIAYPMRARIEGSGVGAIRHCEFSTGAFVEPITRWDPPSVLSFDVASQPPAMKEWSPFSAVHPPHLDGSILSKRGEFRLIALPDGKTRLEGSTWYELSMYPAAYWSAWSTSLIHTIHERVLRHVKHLSEGDMPAR